MFLPDNGGFNVRSAVGLPVLARAAAGLPPSATNQVGGRLSQAAGCADCNVPARHYRTARRRCADRTERHRTRTAAPRSPAQLYDRQTAGQRAGADIGFELAGSVNLRLGTFPIESAIAAELEHALRQPTLRRLKSRTALGSLAEIVVASMKLR